MIIRFHELNEDPDGRYFIGLSFLRPDYQLPWQVAMWMDTLYKRDRLNREPRSAHSEGSRRRLIRDRVNDICRCGHTLISYHDAKTEDSEFLFLPPHGLVDHNMMVRQSSSFTAANDAPAFRHWRFLRYQTSHAGGWIKPNKVGDRFTPEQIELLVTWAKTTIGLEVDTAKDTGIFVRHPDQLVDISDLGTRYGIVGLRNERYAREAEAERQRRQQRKIQLGGKRAS